MLMKALVTAITIAAVPSMASAQPSAWELVHVDASETRFTAVTVHPAQPSHIYAATTHALHESLDGGATWQARFHLPGTAHATAIAVDPFNSSTILLATDHGLYASFDGGTKWTFTFHGSGATGSACLYVAFHPHRHGTALLATRDGLLMSTDGGRQWKPLPVPPAARLLVHFAFDPTDAERVFLVTANAIFIGDLAGGHWQRRFSLLEADTDDLLEELLEELDAAELMESEDTLPQLRAIAVDPQQPSTLYLAGSNGLLRSGDGGVSWQPVTRAGLGTVGITRLLPCAHSPLVLYAATSRGIARYEPLTMRWTVMTLGLPAKPIHDLAAGPHQLWAATDAGLYRYALIPGAAEEGAPPTPRELLSNFVHEPTIAQMHEAAIRYADVHPRKIKAWQLEARLKALVPKFNVSTGTDLTDFRHWDTGGNPDTLLRGKRDLDWDASLNWDLSNFIWSDDQTAIDVRSRLAVQLRDDILGEVTQAYFERRRLQVLLLTNPPEDQQVLLDHELRVQELTATLDGLTGGYFSRQTRITDNP